MHAKNINVPFGDTPEMAQIEKNSNSWRRPDLPDMMKLLVPSVDKWSVAELASVTRSFDLPEIETRAVLHRGQISSYH